MSMYGDDHYGQQKNDLLCQIEEFLEEHPVSELLEIVADAIERREN